jgi:hypothetical protein
MDFIQRAHVHYQTPNSTAIELFEVMLGQVLINVLNRTRVFANT